MVQKPQNNSCEHAFLIIRIVALSENIEALSWLNSFGAIFFFPNEVQDRDEDIKSLNTVHR